jgi:polyhydroxyalkanoate synthase
MIITPAGALRAVGNVRDRVLEGPFADLRRMPRAAIDTGPDDPDAATIGRAHGLARAGSVSTYRYAVHPTARLRGSPVLLVSPLGACGVAFDLRRGNSLVEHLVGEGRAVHQVDDEDLVGHGFEVTPGPADLQRWVDEILPHVVRTVSAHHEGMPVHVVGWSIGGLTAVLMAAAHPDLPLASVTALATPFSLDEVPAVAGARPLALSAGGPLLATLQTVLALMPLPRLLRAVGLASLDELLTTPLTVLAHLDDRDYLAQLEAVDDLRAQIGNQARLVGTYFRALVDARDLAVGRLPVGPRTVDLADVTTPVLLVAGETDQVVPPRAVRAGARRLTGAHTRLTTAPGGHLGVLAGRSARRTTWPRLCAFLDLHDAPAALEGTDAGRRAAARHALPAAHPPAREVGDGTPAGLPATEATSGGTTPPPMRRSSRLPPPKRATRTRGRE